MRKQSGEECRPVRQSDSQKVYVEVYRHSSIFDSILTWFSSSWRQRFCQETLYKTNSPDRGPPKRVWFFAVAAGWETYMVRWSQLRSAVAGNVRIRQWRAACR